MSGEADGVGSRPIQLETTRIGQIRTQYACIRVLKSHSYMQIYRCATFRGVGINIVDMD